MALEEEYTIETIDITPKTKQRIIELKIGNETFQETGQRLFDECIKELRGVKKWKQEQ